MEVISGSFVVGENANIYASESMQDTSRIGRGSIERRPPAAACAESGTIVSVSVKPGEKVARGQFLFETLEGN